MSDQTKSSDTQDILPNQSVWRDLTDLWSGIGATSSKRHFLLFIASVIVIIAANTYGQIKLNVWQGDFYDAIGKRDIPAFVQQLEVFGLIVSGLLVLIIAQTWVNERIKIVIRGMITLHLLAEWLVPKRAYLLQHVPEIGHHPDQRVHEDTRHFAESAAMQQAPFQYIGTTDIRDIRLWLGHICGTCHCRHACLLFRLSFTGRPYDGGGGFRTSATSPALVC